MLVFSTFAPMPPAAIARAPHGVFRRFRPSRPVSPSDFAEGETDVIQPLQVSGQIQEF